MHGIAVISMLSAHYSYNSAQSSTIGHISNIWAACYYFKS